VRWRFATSRLRGRGAERLHHATVPAPALLGLKRECRFLRWKANSDQDFLFPLPSCTGRPGAARLPRGPDFRPNISVQVSSTLRLPWRLTKVEKKLTCGKLVRKSEFLWKGDGKSGNNFSWPDAGATRHAPDHGKWESENGKRETGNGFSFYAASGSISINAC